MSEGIIIAIIGAVGVALAAIITGLFSLLKKENINKKTTINQKGKNNTQIGIQNNYKEG